MYHEDWVDEIHVNEWAVHERAKFFDKKPNKAYKTLESLFLLKAITLLDLSTLFGDDSYSNVTALVNKGVQPLSGNLLRKVLNSITTVIENINRTGVQKSRSLSIKIDATDEKGFNIKISGSTDVLVNDCYELSYEEFIEVKQLLKALHLDDEKNLNESLTKFLSLKNDITDSKNEKKTIRIGAICVYPAFVTVVAETLKDKRLFGSGKTARSSEFDYTAKKELKRKPLKGHDYLIGGIAEDVPDAEDTDAVPIASVAAGFPTGLFPLESKIQEIIFAINHGATEIDIVISRYLVLSHRWLDLFNEIATLRKACGNAKMKTILAVGECGSLENVYKASMVAMMAGSDFIKTSTGKEAINATFASGLIMCRAIKNFYMKTGQKIGFKPAGGIRTAEDSLKWINLVVTELGAEWLSLFRIGASSVLSNVEKRLKELNS